MAAVGLWDRGMAASGSTGHWAFYGLYPVSNPTHVRTHGTRQQAGELFGTSPILAAAGLGRVSRLPASPRLPRCCRTIQVLMRACVRACTPMHVCVVECERGWRLDCFRFWAHQCTLRALGHGDMQHCSMSHRPQSMGWLADYRRGYRVSCAAVAQNLLSHGLHLIAYVIICLIA